MGTFKSWYTNKNVSLIEEYIIYLYSMIIKAVFIAIIFVIWAICGFVYLIVDLFVDGAEKNYKRKKTKKRVKN